MRGLATCLAVIAATCAIARADVPAWTAQLADPQTRAHALSELEQLGDPSALDGLAAAWSADDRDPEILRVAVAIARPHGRRPASWPHVQPLLLAALRALDPKDAHSVDSALIAAGAIGEAHLVAAVPALRAVVDRDRPADADAQLPHVRATAAAIRALGELRDEHARTTLILAAYRIPELMMQIRVALVALGPHTTSELRSILRGEHAEVNALFARGSFASTSAMDFYAALLVSDQHDASAVPELVAALARPALPPYDGATTTQRTAIFAALRTLGGSAAADPVLAIWQDHAQDVATRAYALSIYPYVTRDDAAVADLGQLADDHDTDDTIRVEAATALSRIAHDAHAIEQLQALAKRYRDAGTRERARADGQPRTDARAADAALAAAHVRADRATAAARAAAADPHATTAQIHATAAVAAQAALDLTAATKSHRERTLQFRELDGEASADLAFAHTLQADLASVDVAMRCGADVACYAAALAETPAAVASHLASAIPDVAGWSAADKDDLLAASRARALLELGKRGGGPKAAAWTDALLALLPSAPPVTRQSVLLALPLIAPLPCARCAAALAATVAADHGDASLAALTFDTDLLRAYFATR